MASAKVGNPVVTVVGSPDPETHHYNSHPVVLVEEYPSPEDVKAFIIKEICSVYNTTHAYVKHIFTSLYPTLPFVGNQLCELLLQLKRFEQDSGMPLEEAIRCLRKRLGNGMNFHRRNGDTFVPIGYDRLVEATKALQNQASRRILKNILYL